MEYMYRIGIVASKSGASTNMTPNALGSTLGGADHPLGQAIRIVDQVRARFGLGIETAPLADDPRQLDGINGILLAHQIRSSHWVRALARRSPEGVSLGAPFVLGKAQRVAQLVWPYEDVSRLKPSVGIAQSPWVETSQLQPHHIEAAARSALSLARAQNSPLIWVSGGVGGQEEFAIKTAQPILKEEYTAVAIENLQSAILDRIANESGSSVVLFTTSRVAVLLARLLRCQAWLAWQDRGIALAQGWGPLGPALSVAFLLKRFGLSSEAQAIEAASLELYAQGATQIDLSRGLYV